MNLSVQASGLHYPHPRHERKSWRANINDFRPDEAYGMQSGAPPAHAISISSR